jgi:hypothetical protein
MYTQGQGGQGRSILDFTTFSCSGVMPLYALAEGRASVFYTMPPYTLAEDRASVCPCIL